MMCGPRREDLAVLGDLHFDAGDDRADGADAALVGRLTAMTGEVSVRP